MNLEYKKTGKNINIPVDEALTFTKNKLYEYDELIKATQAKPDYSPYEQPIYFTTSEGKMVQIPENIQKEGIKLHLQEQNLGNINYNIRQQTPIIEEEPIPQDYYYEEDVIDNRDMDIIKKRYSFNWLIIIVICALIFYFCYKK